jgi:hypothetical protein
MKANELRIGNYIQFPTGSIYKVDMLYDDYSSLLYWMPIPLTEECLLKFGYLEMDNNRFLMKGHNVWKCKELFMCDKNGVILKHVHQLQNLYFALTGCELEIK